MVGSKLIHLVAAFLLVLSGVSSSQAQEYDAVAGTAVLCIGGSMVTVYIDASGTPIAHQHVCPDCIVHALPSAPHIGSLHQTHVDPVQFAGAAVPLLDISPRRLLPPPRAPPLVQV